MGKRNLNKPVSDLRAHIGFWMRQISNLVSYSFAARLESRGVTVAEWVVLREMYPAQSVTSPGAIAELTGLTRGAVSKLVSRLHIKKLLSRNESSQDRRYQELLLTPTARALVPELAALADENDAEFFSVLTDSEKKTLMNILKKLAGAHRPRGMPVD